MKNKQITMIIFWVVTGIALSFVALPVMAQDQGELAARYWVDSPDTGPDGWGGRFQFTFLFPK